MREGAPTGEKLGMRAEAKEQLRLSIRIQPDAPDNVFLLCRLLREDGEYDEATGHYRDALRHFDFERPQVYHFLGGCLEAVGLPEAALEAYEDAVGESPRYTAARISAGRLRLHLGRFEGAIEEINAATERYDVQDPLAYAVRGLAKLILGRRGEARQDLEKALEMDPNSARASTALGVLDALEGEFSKGAGRFMRAIEADQYAVEAWVNLGILHLAASKYAEAEALFRAALQRDPTSVAAPAGIGTALQLQGDGDTALEWANRASEADPGAVYPRYLLGELNLRSGRHAEAAAGLEQALRTNFQFLPAYPPLAMAYLRQPELKDGALRAETLFRRANSWTALGCVLAGEGRDEEARDAFLEARKERAEDPLILYGLGYLEYTSGGGNERQRVESSLQSYFEPGMRLAGMATDPASKEAVLLCKALVAQLGEWLLTTVLLDDRFNRADADDVGNKWIEKDRSWGIAITLADRKARFAGKQVNRDLGVTALEREVPRKDLDRVEATFFLENLSDAECGLSMYFAKRGQNWLGLHVKRGMEGGVWFAAMDDRSLRTRGIQSGWQKMTVSRPDAKELRFRFKRSEDTRSQMFHVFLWDASKEDWIPVRKNVPLAQDRNPTWKISVWGRGSRGREYAFSVDDIRVYRRSQR